LVFWVDLHGEIRAVSIGLSEAILVCCFVEGEFSYS
jgi:hypothetical protein